MHIDASDAKRMGIRLRFNHGAELPHRRHGVKAVFAAEEIGDARFPFCEASENRHAM